jgi:hypothetical protein
MHFIVLTAEGYDQVKAELLANKAELWLNPEVLDQAVRDELTQQGINSHLLPEQFNAEKEKSVLAALSYVEQQVGPKQEIYIEYV